MREFNRKEDEFVALLKAHIKKAANNDLAAAALILLQSKSRIAELAERYAYGSGTVKRLSQEVSKLSINLPPIYSHVRAEEIEDLIATQAQLANTELDRLNKL